MTDFELGAFTAADWQRERSFESWKNAFDGLQSRRDSAGLVSPLINHRAFNTGKDWPFNAVCTDPGRAEQAKHKYFQDKPERLGAYGAAILPGGLALRKESPKREGAATGGGRRGEILQFSADSRRRLIGKLMCFDWPKHCAKGKRQKTGTAFFVTLTYSDKCLENLGHYDDATGLEYGVSRAKVKRHLDVLGKRLKRLKGYSGMLWKMEIENRKSGEFKGLPVHIHFHCIVLMNTARSAGALRRYMAGTWADVVGSGDPLHRKAGTQTDIAYGAKNGRLFSYITKYMGKTYEGDPQYIGGLGRVWGIQGDLKLAVPVFVSMTSDAWAKMARRVRRWGKRSRYLSGFSVNCSGVRMMGYGPGLADLLRGLDWRTNCGDFRQFFENFYDAFLSQKQRILEGA